MSILLRHLLKEEWRMHVALGGGTFVFLPIVFGVGTFLAGVLYDLVLGGIEIRSLILVLQMATLIYGMIIGGFAFLSPEIAEKRFGEVKMIMTTQQILPIEARRMYFAAYLKDILFYSAIILLPIASGLLLSSLMTPTFTTLGVLLLLFCQFLSFCLGFSISFALSMAYIRSRGLAIGVVFALGFYVAISLLTGVPIGYLIPPVGLNVLRYTGLDMMSALALSSMSLGAILLFSMLALVFSRERWEATTRNYTNALLDIVERNPFPKDLKLLASKEYIDLVRGGGMAKITFTLVLPMGALVIIRIFSAELPGTLTFNPIFYADMLGFFGMLMYYWISTSDSLDYYEVLPLTPTAVIRAKLALHMILTLVLAAIFSVAIGVIFTSPISAAISFPVVVLTSGFMALVLAYFTGFRTADYLLEPKVLTLFILLGALPLSLAGAFMGVIHEPKYQWLTRGGLSVLITYVVLSSIYYYRKIEDRWSKASFLRITSPQPTVEETL